jgi:hypothetical protein
LANRYNRKETVTYGHAVLSMKNKIEKITKAREDGELDKAQLILDNIDYIFQNDTIDLSEATPVISKKWDTHNRRLEDQNVTKLLTNLHSDDFFEIVPNKGFGPNSAIEKAIDFNDKIVYNQQGVMSFASYTNVVESYKRLQDMKEAGPGNYLYLFDTETIGGKNRSNIWNPLGITEFASQKIDLQTGDVTKTNIVMGIRDTIENKEKVEKILNALGSTLGDPNVKANLTNDANIILNDEELRVTAYRLAIYGDKASEFEFDENLGYMKAKKLASSDINDWLDPEKIKRGWEKNIKASKAASKTKYGINQAELAFIDTMHEMWEAANNGTGMIGGQNIVPFDFKTVNTEIHRMVNMLQYSVDSGGLNGIDASDAKRGLEYIGTKFGGQVGFSAPSEQIFDTLPLIQFIRDKFGIDALYKGDQEAIAAAGKGTAKQENIGAVWFPDLFASGEAHMADFDVDVQRAFFTQKLPEFGDQTFIEYFMNTEQGGLKNLDIKAQTIKTGQEQLLYAKKSTMDRSFGGKGALDYVRNSRTGEVFLNSNYEIMGPNKMPEFKGDINMGTNIKKGHFYYVDSIKKMNAEDISKDLGSVLPELSGPEVFQVRMKMAVADKYKGQGLEDMEYVFHFGSEYELSGWFSSSFDMPLVKNKDGKYVFNGDNAAAILEKVALKDGKLERTVGDYSGGIETLKEQVLEAANKKALTDNTLRDLSDPTKLRTRVGAHLNIRKALTNAGLDNVTKEELADLLHGVPIARMGEMSKKDSDTLIKTIREIAGFTDWGTNETKLYSNSIRKLTTAWDFVGAHDEFYMKTFDNLEKFADQRRYTKAQRDYIFNQVVEKIKTQVADKLFDTPEKIKEAVLNTQSFEGPLQELQNIYDVELPDTFAKYTSKKKQIETGTTLNSNKNILTVRLGDNSSPHKLEDQLVKMMYGDISTEMNPDNYKRISMYHFVNHLSELDEFKDNDYIVKALEHINSNTQTYNTTAVATDVIKAMKEVKAGDPTKGLLKDINIRSLFEGNAEFDKMLNEITDNVIIEAMNETPVPLDLIGKKGKDRTDAITSYIKNNVLEQYLPSRKEFEKTLAGLNDEQIWQKTTLYNTLEKQITNSLTDITDALSQVPGGEFMIMPDGRFVFKQGAEAITIDSIPKIKLDGDTLYGQVGRSNIQVHLDFGFDSKGNMILTTNLGDAYEKNKVVTRRIKKEVEKGTLKMDTILNINSHLSEKFRQDSRYEFKSGDWYSNFMVGTGQVQTLLPEMFGEEGTLKALGDKVNISEKERKVLADAFKNMREIKPGELDPQMNQYLSAYWVEIVRAVAEARGTDDAVRLGGTLTIGTKGKGKLEVGKLMGSNMRFATGFANSLDNLGRPVVDGSGNVKFIRNNQVKEAAKRASGLLYDGALFESIDTDRINKKVGGAVGELTTGWTSRTAYVGEMGIKSILQNNIDKVLNNNTIESLADDKKQNIYDMMFAYVNTFEQQKVADARTFDAVTGGNISANTIKLSTAKDFINIPKEERLLHADKYQRLMNLMGDIEMTPEGILSYKSSVGDIVKYGETIIPFATYGGESTNWSSKMNRSLLRFQVFNKQGVALTESEISQVLNEKASLFKNIDMGDKEKRLNALVKALDDYEINFTVEDINKITLPKILANDSEKSMNHLLYAKTGTINEQVAQVFKNYSEETAELLQGTVLTEQSLMAYFKDVQKRADVVKKAGFKDWNDFMKAWSNEMYTMTDVLFGKGGIFEGFTDIANDSLLGHDNAGTMLIGSLNETVAMLGKYSSADKIESQDSLKAGLKKFVELYNKEEVDEKGNKVYKNRFFKDSSGEGIGIELVDGRLRLENGRSLDASLDNSNIVDYDSIEKLVREANEFLVNEGAGKEDQLIHKVKQVEEDGRHVFYVDDKEGKEIFGRMIYGKKDGKDIIEGSIGSTYKKIVVDPETQSGIPQEYFDTKMDYMKLKGKKVNLEHQLEALKKEYEETGFIDPDHYAEVQSQLAEANVKLTEMDEYLTNVESMSNGKTGFRIGDQEEKIIKNYFINENRFDAIDERVATGQLSKEAVEASQILSSLDRTRYGEGNASVVYQTLIDDLHDQRYYNPYFDTEKLTAKKVKAGGKYEHLKGIYDQVVKSGDSPILGVETAQLIQDIQMASLANEFNNNNKDLNKLKDAGFEVLTPKEYIQQFGDPNTPNYESVYKKNVLLEMDMMDGSGPRYVAVPAMGSVLDHAEVKQDWHKHAGNLARTYVEEFEKAHMDPNEVPKILEKMDKLELELSKSTSEFTTKGSALHNRMKQEVHAAVDRVKIISTMADPNSPLMKQAQIDGRSLADWVNDGVYVDYAFDSLESFEKRGYFNKDYLEKMNMTKEDMIEHLRVHGDVMIDDRYPNIRERSLTPVRHFLAIDDKGMNFLANNATMMAPWTMLAMNADSDGDSVSRFLAKHKNIDHVQYGVARQRAISRVSTVEGYDAMDAAAKEKLIKSEAVHIMKNDFGIGTKKNPGLAEEAYDIFFEREAEMQLTAMDDNIRWYDKVANTWKSNSEKTVMAMSLKNKKGFTGAEVSGGKSVFGHTRFTALTETPTWKRVRSNMDTVNQGLALIQNNMHLLSEETQEYAKKLLEGSADIFSFNDENEILDQALVAMNELVDNPDAQINRKGFSNFQMAAIERSRINKYHIEGMKKLGVTATGNVNTALYGISQAIKSHYGDVNNPFYDEIMRSITSDMSYLLEEAPISGKKHEVKAGDTRLVELGQAFRDMEQKGPTDEVVNNMQNYFKTYMNHDEIEEAYDAMVNRARVPEAKRLTTQAEKVNHMVKQYTQYISEALDPDSELYAEVKGHSLFGRGGTSSEAIKITNGRVKTGTNLGDVIYQTTGRKPENYKIPKTVSTDNAQEAAKKMTQMNTLPDINPNEKKIFEGIESVSNKISKTIINSSGGIKKSLGLGVVGLAAGLIAAGYASGNPLDDPDPATIDQKGYEGVKAAPEMMFSSGQGFAPNNTGGYIINIKGDTKKGNRQLKKALKQATRNAVGPTGVTMNIRTSQSQGTYSDKDIENILNNYF